ncbi:MAG TPA: hypothetical protein VN578_05480 [Candidatus Binatia bacterium]|jgi:hypothetical protein|nr:hypothetical protein [Candidatus Binatia bacterium]
MQRTLAAAPPIFPELETNPTFNVIVAYEDFEAGMYAKKTCDLLSENLGRHCAFASQMWKFDVLKIPKLHELALNDASEADLIIISSKGGELPVHVQTLLELCLSEPHRPIALAALFVGDAHEKTAQTQAYLAEVAKRGQLEFFAQSNDCPAFKPGTGAIQRDITPSRWGIRQFFSQT